MGRQRKERGRALEALYARVPEVKCKGLCFDSCGPIGMTELEARRLEAHLGRPLPPAREITCPLLTKDGRCRAYAARPLVCRLWGAMPELPCPHGCAGSGSLSAGEGARLLMEAQQVSGGEPVLLYPPAWKKERFR